MKLRKLAALSLTAVMMSAALAGCGNNNSASFSFHSFYFTFKEDVKIGKKLFDFKFRTIPVFG